MSSGEPHEAAWYWLPCTRPPTGSTSAAVAAPTSDGAPPSSRCMKCFPQVVCAPEAAMLQQRADELLCDGPMLVHDVSEEAWHPAHCRGRQRRQNRAWQQWRAQHWWRCVQSSRSNRRCVLRCAGALLLTALPSQLPLTAGFAGCGAGPPRRASTRGQDRAVWVAPAAGSNVALTSWRQTTAWILMDS